MKRKMITAVLTAAAVIVMAVTAFADEYDYSVTDSVPASDEGIGQTLLPLPNGEMMTLELTSGAGGWWNDMYLLADGSFVENSHSQGWGDNGERVYYDDLSMGVFSDIQQVDEYSYSMTLAMHQSFDGIAFETGGRYIFYTPGAVIDDPDEEIYFWANGSAGSETAKSIRDGKPISTYALRDMDGDATYFMHEE